MLGQQLLVDELDHVQVDVDGIQIEQRHAELVGGRDGDLARVAYPVGNEMRHEVRALTVDGRKRRHEVGFRYHAVLHESARQAGQRTLSCGDRHGNRVKSLATFDNKHRTFTVASRAVNAGVPLL